MSAKIDKGMGWQTPSIAATMEAYAAGYLSATTGSPEPPEQYKWDFEQGFDDGLKATARRAGQPSSVRGSRQRAVA